MELNRSIMEMMIYQVDAFTDTIFGGNPAAVIPLDTWLPDHLLQNIAGENNLSETAYFVKKDNGYHLRWFTPEVEVELCGHATLASAYVLFNVLGYHGDAIRFDTLSGPLIVSRKEDNLIMDFPVTTYHERVQHPGLSEALGKAPDRLYEAKTKFMAVYDDVSAICKMEPDFSKLRAVGKNTIVTARGEDCDFISRFFAPVSGIDEDPVTGSAHTLLTPYWAGVLGKKSMEARQVSRRGGKLSCELAGDRVKINGKAKLYLSGRIEI